ncbi:bifunctional methylenetetrahydrofolate dehydrogenase/methenyltetrahydrofolate cyclohydrolase FolD [Solimonas marina]|uniref:Bifunctional protein FolD n=1 Tax=Solimonas marina TaxID=2714601 RepID=A0A969W922_9GAMM|nr:bifunctional methylenetetrahydrofolate dehydrogenase/methenyltetrahydrofolate cyclohydrolase FolD [Solimonas marina]NKF21775.1 bifunctional methylenetetrahydrofolate dehydrogenase/methenyltetrahydrofolate cyclohydrolase FolD [Solimonas marina]
MSAQLIDGKAVAAAVHERVRLAVARRIAAGLRRPALATVLVGADPASEIYVRNKRLTCDKVGVRSVPMHFDATVGEAELLSAVDALNADDDIDGILVQLPLPGHINAIRVTERIRADKDVDGFHPYNIGRLAQRMPVLRPCTPYGVIELLKTIDEPFKGRRAVVVGASNHVGRPMMLELMLAGATATCCHRFTADVAGEVARADIVVAAVGKPRMVQGVWIKPGATVIDVGINRLPDGKICGDVDFDAARERAAFITPVPGGVGPMTVAMLMHNTLLACTSRDGTAID